MLRWRLSLSALLIGALVGLCVLDSQIEPPSLPFWLMPVALIATILGSGEIIRLTRKSAPETSAWLIYVGNVLIVGSCLIPLVKPDCPVTAKVGPLAWPLATFVLCVLTAFLDEMRRYKRPGMIVVQLASTILGLAYVGLLMSFVVQLRFLDRNWNLGLIALLSMIAVVKMGDTGAFTVGRLIGRHKMTPVLSPGKTWEGFGGAMLFAALGAWLFLHVIVPTVWKETTLPGPSWGWLPYGLIVGLTGLLGDLAESLLKRDAGVKDSSDWMPGFGGMLDLLDSILFAAPVAWLFWVAGGVG